MINRNKGQADSIIEMGRILSSWKACNQKNTDFEKEDYLPPSRRLAQYMTLNPCRIPLRASLASVDQVIEMVSGDVAMAWTFSGGELGTEI